jgi:hypothetical protein
MNPKHILFPCPGIFQPPSLPQNFPPILTSLPPLLPPSYLPPSPHFSLTPSPKLRRAPELEYNRASRKRETQGLRKAKSSTLKECGEEKATRALHPKCRSERRKVSSFLSLHFVFFEIFFKKKNLFEKKKTPLSSCFMFLFPTYLPHPPTYLPLLSFFVLLLHQRRQWNLHYI